MAQRARLVIAANRLPVQRVSRGGSIVWERSPGGLVSAMAPIVEKRGAAWVGWDGGAGRAPRIIKSGKMSVLSVQLTRTEVDRYYQGFCNGTLWPLYHDAIQTPEFHREWWHPYREVNMKFATRMARVAGRGALVWVHDYHLQLVPKMLRDLRPDLKIGFFLHIPFPPEELFAWLPWRAALLRGLLGCDLVGFQTEASATNFSRLARRYTPAEGTDRELTIEGRTVHCRAMPISIDADDFDRLARSPKVLARSAEIRSSLGDRKVLLAVDRMDYTKGITDRLKAFEELLKEKRLSADNAVLMQIAVPSREEALGYEQVREEVERTVGRINGQFSAPGKVAVHYFRRSLSREELVAYYLAADVMLVTPLRDGMNLVAKEYCACRTDHTGVLVLSEFAGAARELRRALLVNPRDIDAFMAAITQALRMREREEKMRMSILRAQVRRHDVFEWANQFVETLQEVGG
ncbi:MAG TPA: trehalose-6-phosphate synthase [Phycisphaerales bacterium]|nr:trehalose-6-phosphate synthase [Phycisphaerales bacterium]